MTEEQLLNAMIGKSGLQEEQTEDAVHAIVQTIAREFEGGDPAINFETGTLDLMIDKHTLISSLVDKANISATEAQGVLQTIVELMVRL
jgi:nucleoid DNA-binding protein